MTLGAPIPVIRIFDEAKAREFYLEFLGFTVDWEHRFDEQAPIYLQIRRGACVLHLSEHHGDGSPGAVIRIAVGELDLFIEALRAKQYKYARPGVETKPWGLRESELTDPFRNKLVFYTPPQPASG